jgi:hypothetical protein
MALRGIIDNMIQVQRALGDAALEARRDPARRAAVIELRRRFADAVRDVSTAAERDPQLQADPALAAEFRRRFSEARSRIAVFQAKWPAVLLDSADSDSDFDRTARELRAANRCFLDWAQATLPR